MENKKEQRWIFDLEQHNNNTSQDAKDWVESNFPDQHYGKEILDLVYEGWDLRSLLEQAYMAGKESAQ